MFCANKENTRFCEGATLVRMARNRERFYQLRLMSGVRVTLQLCCLYYPGSETAWPVFRTSPRPSRLSALCFKLSTTIFHDFAHRFKACLSLRRLHSLSIVCWLFFVFPCFDFEAFL